MEAEGWTSDWRDLGAPPEQLRLAPTLLSGMSFRWRVTPADTFIGVLGDCICELRETAGGAEYRTHGAAARGDDADAAREMLRSHLSLDRGPRDPAAGWAGAWAAAGGSGSMELSAVAAHHSRCAAVLRGVRVLTIGTHLEALVTFMGSANNSIKRNMQVRLQPNSGEEPELGFLFFREGVNPHLPAAPCTHIGPTQPVRAHGRTAWPEREVRHAGIGRDEC